MLSLELSVRPARSPQRVGTYSLRANHEGVMTNLPDNSQTEGFVGLSGSTKLPAFTHSPVSQDRR